MSDSLFQVEPPNNITNYTLEVFRKVKSDTGRNLSHIQTIVLEEQDLVELNQDNFAEKTKLDFDIRNASQLRWFLADLFYIRARATNLFLLSFDNEDSLNCQKWNLEVNFNFEDDDDVLVSKSTEYTKIKCEESWKQIIGYKTDGEEAPVRQKVGLAEQESYFLNYISLMCNLYTYYFVVGLIVNLSKFHRLEKQKLVKERWVASRQNAEDFKRFKSWDRNVSVAGRPREMSFFSFSNIVLLLSNTFLLLANIFIIISTLPLELAYDSFYEGYVNYFLGLGVSMSWINAATVLSTIETFQVVPFALIRGV